MTFGFVEEIVTPVDERTHRLLPRHGGSAASGEQTEALVEPVEQRARAQEFHPRCREFDGECNAVESPAQLRHRFEIRFVEREFAHVSLRATFE